MRIRYPYSACPLCESAQLADLKTGDCSKHPLYNPVLPPVIQWRKCLACEHVFTDGHFTREAQRLIFAKTQHPQQPGHDIERQRQISAKMVERVASAQGSAGGCWLDIGFGSGSLLQTAQEWGYEPVGLDLRQSTVGAMQALGFEAHLADVMEFDQFGRFSVVSMADVLEHMPFPKAALMRVFKLLQPGGVLFVSMPNSDSFAWNALDRAGQNPYWGEIEHFHNFGRKRLYALLQECGFVPVRYGISERYRVAMEVVARVPGAGPGSALPAEQAK